MRSEGSPKTPGAEAEAGLHGEVSEMKRTVQNSSTSTATMKNILATFSCLLALADAADLGQGAAGHGSQQHGWSAVGVRPHHGDEG